MDTVNMMLRTNQKLRMEQGDSPLGITAECSAPPSLEKVQQNRRQRFKIQRVAAQVLGLDAQEKLRHSMKKHESDIHRTCGCMWTALADNVELMRSKEHGTGHIKNVATCGSVWACPVCTAKIQERRREEIAKAMDTWYNYHNLHDGEQQKQVVMVTLTAPHYYHQSLEDLRAMQAEALKELRKSSGSYTRMLKDNGFKGLIRALEVTVSKRNGWHLHTHELWFVNKNADVKRILERTKERWESACVKAGLLDKSNLNQMKAFAKHSVDIKASVSCSEYLAKMDDNSHWGADREVAKQSTKSGKKSGLHPFGLLAEISEKTDKADWATAKFIEYANGMKGARQLYWSSRLKDFFDINEKTDKELSEEDRDTLERVESIHKSLWYKIANAGERATLLEKIELCDHKALKTYLNSFIKIQV